MSYSRGGQIKYEIFEIKERERIERERIEKEHVKKKNANELRRNVVNVWNAKDENARN